MIDGVPALILHLWVLGGLVVVSVGMLVALMHRQLLAVIANFGIHARQQFIWCLALLPWLTGIYTILLTIAPSLSHQAGFSADHCHSHKDGHGHICWNHESIFDVASWQGIVALVLIVAMILIMSRTGYRLFQQLHQIGTLLAFAQKQSQDYYIIDSEIPAAFTVGVGKPEILVTRGLHKALDAQELEIVLCHERAHRQRKDPLRLWVFGLLLWPLPAPVRRRLISAMELTLEQAADSVVINSGHPLEKISPALVAKTLVKIQRLVLRHGALYKPSVIHCSFGGAVIEERVREILALDHGRPFPKRHLLAGIGLLVAMSFCYAEGLHHFIENIVLYHLY